MERIRLSKEIVWLVASEKTEFGVKEFSLPVSKPKRKARRRKLMSQSRLILARAEMRGYTDVRKVGEGGLINRQFETNGWLVMPPDMYKGIIPLEVTLQAEDLTKGIPIKGFLVAEDKRRFKQKVQDRVLDVLGVSPDWSKVATGFAKVLTAIAIALAAIPLLLLILLPLALGAALVYDPLLIAVTAEDEWIAVAEWWD